MYQKHLLKRGLVLEYITLAWNVFECGIVLTLGIIAGSIAMIGFGIDSLIEIFASIVAVWQLLAGNKKNEKMAEKLIGIAFFLVSIYIFFQSAATFFSSFHPRTSILGMVMLGSTVIAMFILAHYKEKVGKQLQHPVLIKEAKVTFIDGMLAMSVLIGISANTLFGFWWADPLAGLVIVYYGIKEGVLAFR